MTKLVMSFSKLRIIIETTVAKDLDARVAAIFPISAPKVSGG